MNISPINFSTQYSNALHSNKKQNINFGKAEIVKKPHDCTEYEQSKMNNLKKFIDGMTTEKELFEISLSRGEDKLYPWDDSYPSSHVDVLYKGDYFTSQYIGGYWTQYDWQIDQAIEKVKKDFEKQYANLHSTNKTKIR